MLSIYLLVFFLSNKAIHAQSVGKRGLFDVENRVTQQIYLDVPEEQIRTNRRLYSQEGAIGSQFPWNGIDGVIKVIKSDSDVEDVVNDKHGHGPFVAVMWLGSQYYSTKYISKMRDNLAGVIVYDRESKGQIEKQSFDRSCPNDRWGMYYNNEKYGKCRSGSQNERITWNRAGDGVWMQDWMNLPIVLFPRYNVVDENSTQLNDIFKCYNKYNRKSKWPLCAVSFYYRQYASGDAVRCTERWWKLATFPDIFGG